MAIPVEIERKFLVCGNEWRQGARCSRIVQGYIAQRDGVSVRVRRLEGRAFLTVKAANRTAKDGSEGLGRTEFEYPIPPAHADYLLSHVCDRSPVEKMRYEVTVDGCRWVVDEFSGLNRGLILAEIELTGPTALFSVPDWVGQEVTGDPRFRNSHLYRHPYQTWAPVGTSFGPAVGMVPGRSGHGETSRPRR